MRRQHLILFLALGATLWQSNPARAQIGVYSPPVINPRPPVSPYLNILRGNPAVNYYGIVRPQQQTAQQLSQLQRDIATTQTPSLAIPLDQQLLGVLDISTGHPVSFQNTSHYFNNRGGATGVGVAGGAGNPIGRASLGQAAPPIRPIFVNTGNQ